ncbi:MAG TPA: PhoU domain-containing protein [Candidatus Angelobacter sp.]|nr:PhoU domain-containing protein [Candidatus Angelobacter sp.]
MVNRTVKPQSAENKINALLVCMGRKVDEAVNQAIMALLRSNSHFFAGVMENAVAIQELELTIDQAVFSALEQGDLRPSSERATLLVNISKDLARLGKLAANLGRKVTEVGKHHDQEDFSRLQPLAIAVSHLCRQTMRSLIWQDPVLARNAAAGSASVDAYRDYVLRGPGRQEPYIPNDQDLHLIFASRCLEQIADHAHHLAQNLVLFLEQSPAPEHEKSRSMAC